MKKMIGWMTAMVGILAICVWHMLCAPFGAGFGMAATESARRYAPAEPALEGYGVIQTQCGNARYTFLGALVNKDDNDTVELYVSSPTEFTYDLRRKTQRTNLPLLHFQKWDVASVENPWRNGAETAVRAVYLQYAPLNLLGDNSYPSQLIWRKPQESERPKWKGVQP